MKRPEGHWAWVSLRQVAAAALVTWILGACGGRTAVKFEDEGDGDSEVDPEPEDCGDGLVCVAPLRCVAGECREQMCAPGEMRCNSGSVELCADEQVGWALFATCAARETCVEDGELAYCRDDGMACPPEASWCETPTSVGTCHPDGVGVQVTPCASGWRCEAGACLGPVCSPGLFCDENAIRSCSDDGFEVTVLQTCLESEVCVNVVTPQCATKVCEPNQATCLGNTRLVCNDNGASFASGADCGGNVCVEGECLPVICTPGARTCSGGNPVQCSADGTAFVNSDICSSSEYCLPGLSDCQMRVCEPNEPLCLGNSTAQCNSVGSGYLTGMDCGQLTCVSGTCRASTLFEDDFDDGNVDDWLDRGFGYTMQVTDETSAGGGFSLFLAGGFTQHYDGYYRQFMPGLVPERVTYSARHEGNGSGTYFTLHDTATNPALSNEVAFVYFRGDGFLAIGQGDSAIAVAPWVAGQWYEISLVFDWPNHEFDIFVDGVLAAVDNPFRGGTAANQVRWLSLYHFSDTEGYWDSIVFE